MYFPSEEAHSPNCAGDWSDVSPLWDSYPDVRDALKPKMQEDDGEVS